MKFYLQIDRVMVSAAIYCRRNLGRFSVFTVQKQRYFIYTDIKDKQQLHMWEAETRLYLDKSQQLSTNLMLLTNSLSVWQF